MRFEPEDLRDADAFRGALRRELDGQVVTEADGDLFVFHDPDGVTVPEARFPWCTVLTGDRHYDATSHLDRDGPTYRVNLGLTRQGYEERFGPAPRQPAGVEVVDTGVDHTTTDTVMPHPFYAPLHWVCVVAPGEGTREELAALVEQAHGQARRVYDNQRRHRT